MNDLGWKNEAGLYGGEGRDRKRKRIGFCTENKREDAENSSCLSNGDLLKCWETRGATAGKLSRRISWREEEGGKRVGNGTFL